MADLSNPGDAVLQGSFPSGLSNPQGAAWDGTQLIIVDNTGDELWTVADVTQPGDAVLQGDFPSGLTGPQGGAWDGTQLIIVDTLGSGGELWTLADVTQPGTAVNRGSFPSGLSTPLSGAWDGTQLIIVDAGGDELWTLADVTQPGDAVLQGSFPSGLTGAVSGAWDGDQLIVLDFAGAELWTVGDVTDPGNTTTTVNRGSFPSGLSNPQGAAWDGTRLIILDNDGDELWTLTPPPPVARTADADPIDYEMALSEATGVATAPTHRTADADPIDYGMALSEATGAATPASTVTINTVPPKDGEVARFLVTIGADTGNPQTWLDQRSGQDVGDVSGDYEITSTIEINRIRLETGTTQRIRFNRGGSGSFATFAANNPTLQWYVGTETQVHNLPTQQSVTTGQWAWTADSAALDTETSAGSVINIVCGIEPTAPARTADATPINYEIALSEATGTVTAVDQRTADADPINYEIALSEATGTATPAATPLAPSTAAPVANIERLLRSPAIRMTTQIELIDFDGRTVTDVTNHLIVEGSYIARDSTGPVAGIATFVFDDISSFDFGRNLLVPSVTVHDLGGRWLPHTWRMGTWVMTPPAGSLARTEVTSIECVDVIALLSTFIDQSFSVASGTNIATAVNVLLASHGLAGLSAAIPQIGLELASSPAWAITEQLTWLDIANDLLNAAAHTGLYTNRTGTVTAHPWTPIGQVGVAWTFDETAPDSWISDRTEREAVTDPVPNVWIGVCTDPASPNACARVVVTNNNPDSPWSVANQGQRRNVRIVEANAPDTGTLTAVVEAAAQADILRSARVRVYAGPVPALWASDVVRVNLPTVGIFSRRGVVREWKLPLDPANNDAEYVIDVG